jgi:predicted RND superfamily exporter protein
MALLFLRLDPEQLETLPHRLNAQAIDAKVRENKTDLMSPLGMAKGPLIRADPLGLVTPVLDRLQGLRGRLHVGVHDDLLITDDDTYVLLFVLPESASANIDFSKIFVEEIVDEIRATISNSEIQGSVGIGPPVRGSTSIHVGIAGPAATLVDYRSILASDIRRISGIALMAVLLLFLVAFRRIDGLIIAGVPLVVGIAWTLGVTALLFGRINILTAGAVPILCGLAIDFTIHLYNRYLEESQSGNGAEAMVTIANGETGVAIVATAATTTWGCLALGTAVQPGLRTLGFVCAIGMVLSLIASLVLVPALVALFGVNSGSSSRALAGFGLRSMVAAAINRPRLFVVVGLVLGGTLAGFGFGLRVDEGFRGPGEAPSKQLLKDISRRVGTLMEPELVAVHGSSANKVLVDASRISEALLRLLQKVHSPVVAVVSASDILPPASRQQAALEVLNRLRDDGSIDPDRVGAELLSAMDRHGFHISGEVREATARVVHLLSLEHPVSLQEARRGVLGSVLDDLVVEDSDGGIWALVFVYPRIDVTSRELISFLQHAVEESGAVAEVIGARALGHAMKPLVFRDAMVCSLIGVTGILVILFITFGGRPVMMICTLVPVMVGVVAGIGIMTLLSIDFNPASISMIPLILGIGIDDGIHMVHRYLGRSGERLVDNISHTGRGIVMTSLTNIVAFGSLTFAAYQGLFSSGIFVAISVGAMLVASVTFLPALLKISSELHLRPQDRTVA